MAIPFTKKISWDEYIKYRPAYAKSMWDLWMGYHEGPLETAHDVGAGGGVASNDLATFSDVKRIYVSDPGKEHLEFAEKILNERHPGVQFVFKNTVAEDPWVDTGSLDFLCCCEALHWVDVSKGMPIMADSLRAGGTFAAIYYLPYPKITNCPNAQTAMMTLLDDFGKNAAGALVGQPAWTRGFSQSNAGLDFVPFDPATWTDVRRIEINTDKWPSSKFMAERFGEAPDHSGDVPKERWEDDQWKRQGSVEELRQLLANFLGAPDTLWECKAWQEVLAAAKEIKGQLDLAFQVAIVLARKK